MERWGLVLSAAMALPGCGESFSSAPEASDAAGGAAGAAGATAGALVINEVDYDNPGLDTAELIEIFNGSPGTRSLDALSIVLVNGAATENREYARIDLSGELAPGEYLVAHAASVVVPPGTRSILFVVPENQIQNAGDAPDAIGILHRDSGKLIDALSYGGSVKGAEVDGIGPLDFTEGSPPEAADPGDGSLVRMPNGADTNDAASDWQLSSVPTPGKANTL